MELNDVVSFAFDAPRRWRLWDFYPALKIEPRVSRLPTSPWHPKTTPFCFVLRFGCIETASFQGHRFSLSNTIPCHWLLSPNPTHHNHLSHFFRSSDDDRALMALPVVDTEYLKQIDKARRDLRALIASKNCAPIMLRLA